MPVPGRGGELDARGVADAGPAVQPAAKKDGSRPAATGTAAAPPRSRLRREIPGDETWSLMAWALLQIGWAGRSLAAPGVGERAVAAGLRRRGMTVDVAL